MSVQRFPEDAPRPYDDVGWTFGYLYNVTADAIDGSGRAGAGRDPGAERHRDSRVVDLPRRFAWYAVHPAASAYALEARYELHDVPVQARGTPSPRAAGRFPAGRLADLRRRHRTRPARGLGGAPRLRRGRPHRRAARRRRPARDAPAAHRAAPQLAQHAGRRLGPLQPGPDGHPVHVPARGPAAEGPARPLRRHPVPGAGPRSSAQAIFAGVDPKFSPLPYRRTRISRRWACTARRTT
jgi:hypothetical protein